MELIAATQSFICKSFRRHSALKAMVSNFFRASCGLNKYLCRTDVAQNHRQNQAGQKQQLYHLWQKQFGRAWARPHSSDFGTWSENLRKISRAHLYFCVIDVTASLKLWLQAILAPHRPKFFKLPKSRGQLGYWRFSDQIDRGVTGHVLRNFARASKRTNEWVSDRTSDRAIDRAIERWILQDLN